MNELLLFAGAVIAICVLMNRLASRLPVPSLLLFLALGMCFGVNGLLGIAFDDYALSEQICSAALVFIMFYGGFGTNIRQAKPVMARAFLLSTLGVVLTAGLVGGFVHFFLKVGWLESLLVGAVMASTDAASVFGILRARKLALKDNTDSLLELESGSNDPVAYLMTMVLLALIGGQEISVPLMLFRQMAFGLAGGFAIGWLAVFLLGKGRLFHGEQSRTIFLLAVAVIAYALPAVLGGNGYLSVYFCGIYMGNSEIVGKKDMVHFFDTLTEIAQMVIFFLLGLLVTPAELPAVFLPALAVMLFLTFIARPLSTAVVLTPFRASAGQVGLVSWSGLRGVASIVFSIYVVLAGVKLPFSLFNLVFVVVLLSLSVQGSLLPLVSRRLGMLDEKRDVLRTFNDYQENGDLSFIKLHVAEDSPMVGKYLRELSIPEGQLVVLILRKEETILPDGDTPIQAGDLLVMAAPTFEDRENLTLEEIVLENGHRWCDQPLRALTPAKRMLIIMVRRNGVTIVPNGDTVLQAGDVLAVARF